MIKNPDHWIEVSRKEVEQMAVASVGPRYEYILINKYVCIFTIGRAEKAAYIRPCLCKMGRSSK